MFDAIIETPIGDLGLQFHQAKLIAVQFLEQQVIPIPFARQPLEVRKITNKIEAFFSFPEDLTHLPYKFFRGTAFQKKVWQALRKIPLGETLTYGQLAEKLNTSARAIGMACRTNPLPVVIPCHRIVAATHLGGYCGHIEGEKLSIKEWLLAHERSSC
ncbi:MAG: hypothetical protein BGO43_13290 [Gammaproteobacteria bacterium 39-13]|nr:methylated-DNA--[protein]-cysteine S-methyltransferase [Gammaproteobacteria bacterium]OJV95918.1 MAG: hypothetical protein BGO43_13290 [Gammaproteobacteria bacterium 39-13]